ncbi:MAG: hypothetical protein IH933_03345 [Euryarchaeota archaeon]|nr:hypothetical protein [Euryarchaeota archaeon]
MADLRIRVADRECTAEWVEDNPNTQKAIEAALPLAGDGRKWGEELYFRTEVDVEAENTQTEVPVGAVAYWPGGNAICLFWGPTPASRGDEPRAAAPVSVVARITDTAALAATAADGAQLRLELA